ncbi:MAG: bacillithiol biosynthesis BshC [Gemmatimonadaceae bacterium]
MTDVRIITEPLGGSALSRALQQGTAPTAWTASPPASADEWRSRAQQRSRERNWDECWAVLAPAIAATGAAAERLARVRSAGGVVVTTGQQPGLFGGPVYTWSKAMGALALADALERATGIPTAAVFWAATDDADFAEASYTVLGATGGADVLRSEHAPAAGTPMSLAALGDVSAQLHRLRDAAFSAADPRPLDAIERAYGDQRATVGSAYVQMLRDLLAPLGMPVLDASHPAVRVAGNRIMRVALEKAADVERSLAERTKELRGAGFDAQVEDVKGLSLVFTRDGDVKRRLSVAEARGASAQEDAVLTPNVLLRPVLEREILPTVAYLGGPGELAYFAQTGAVADALGVEKPLALPRWSCTLIEPHVQRLLDRVGVTPEALAAPDALEGSVARAAMSEQSAAALEGVRAAIAGLPGALAPESGPLGLDPAMEGAMQSLQHRVDRLERRLVAGIKRREISLLRDVATLRAALYPRGARQERALNLIPTLARHGLGLLDEMREAAGGHAMRLIDRSARA